MSSRSVHGGWSRRAVFAGATGVGTAGLLTGCAWDSWGSWGSSAPPPPDPLEPLYTGTRELADRYDALVRTRDALAERLRPILEAHRAHAQALAELLPGVPEAAESAGSATPATPASGEPTPPLADPELDDDEVLSQLREQESEAQQEATRACLAATPARAWLLGAIVAARACHVEVLA